MTRKIRHLFASRPEAQAFWQGVEFANDSALTCLDDEPHRNAPGEWSLVFEDDYPVGPDDTGADYTVDHRTASAEKLAEVIRGAADDDPGELAEPAIHRASRNIPEHYAGAFLICARCRAEVGRV